MGTSIKFTASNTVVNGVNGNPKTDSKGDKILVATAIKTALFGPKGQK